MVTISSEDGINTVEVFNTYGQLVDIKKGSSNSVIIDVSGYTSGTYVALINEKERRKFVVE
jgi:hypothetical protein